MSVIDTINTIKSVLAVVVKVVDFATRLVDFILNNVKGAQFMFYNTVGRANRNNFTRNAVKHKKINDLTYQFRGGIRL